MHPVPLLARVVARRLFPRYGLARRWSSAVPLRKYDIINALGREFRARSYLEICTPTTGMRFDHVDRSIFPLRHRLMYRCVDGFADGMAVAGRTSEDSSVDLVASARRRLPAGDGYDIVLVDPWHTYAASRSDILGAMTLLKPTGILVVHDCGPTDPDIVGPEPTPGDWCGLTYQAFVDFLFEVRCAGYCTVDTDYGCGVVYNLRAPVPDAWRGAGPPEHLRRPWSVASARDDDRFAFFVAHRAALLNLVRPAAFAAAHGWLQALPTG